MPIPFAGQAAQEKAPSFLELVTPPLSLHAPPRKWNLETAFAGELGLGLGVWTYQCWARGSHAQGLAAPRAGLGQKVHLQDRERAFVSETAQMSVRTLYTQKTQSSSSRTTKMRVHTSQGDTAPLTQASWQTCQQLI